MKVYKIVLTGGPCGGKSEILEKLIQHYSQQENLKVFVVTETATEVINSGLSFLEMNSPYNFQKIIMERQLNKENTMYTGIDNSPLEEINLVFLDRGLIDNKAYLPAKRSQKDFDSLLQSHSLNEITILDNYDLVIDLISLATTNPEKYECNSNTARYEDVEMAKTIDKKITEAWLGHSNIHHIYPTEEIKQKLEIVLGYIEQLINGKQLKYTQTYQIETPYTIFELLNDNNSKKIDIVDYYLSQSEEENRTIISKRKYKECETFTLITKDNNDNILTRQIIDYNMFQALTGMFGIEKEISKQQYTFIGGTDVYQITCYEGFTTLDVEITNNKENSDLSAFNIIDKIDDFYTFYDTQTKKYTKIKKCGII